MEKLNRPQPVPLLCADDIIRNPATKRLVRITESVEESHGFVYFNGTDHETTEPVGFRLRKSSRVNVWID